METDRCVLVEASKFLREKWFGAKLLKITVVCLHLETNRLLLQHFLNFFSPLCQDTISGFKKILHGRLNYMYFKKIRICFSFISSLHKACLERFSPFLEEEIVCRTFPVLSLFLFIFKSLLFCLVTKVWIFLLTCLLVFPGEYDHLPEVAFYMVGDISEAVAKAERLAEEVQ